MQCHVVLVHITIRVCIQAGHFNPCSHDDVIKWKHFTRYWPFVRRIHRCPVNSPHKGQWRGALMFSLICVWINGWVNNGEADDLRCYRPHYYVTVTTGSHYIHISRFCVITHPRPNFTYVYATLQLKLGTDDNFWQRTKGCNYIKKICST